MPKISAGLLMFKKENGDTKVFLVHPGGPFWSKRDYGAWSIPKGECDLAKEDLLTCAKREFREEVGSEPVGSFISLGEVKQAGGKLISAWAFEGEFDPSNFKSNSFTMEWPPRSGKMSEFPEVDQAEWFDLKTAAQKINPAQQKFLDELLNII